MIKNKEKIEQIYNYLLRLSNLHTNYNDKYNGYSKYNKNDKDKCFSVQNYDFDGKYHKFLLYDVDFKYKSNFFSSERRHERIFINLSIHRNLTELKIKEFIVKDNSNLHDFF